MITHSEVRNIIRARLWILGLGCIAVHLMFAAIHVADSWNYMRRNPFPVTSLSMGGGVSPLWYEDKLLYLPVFGEGIRMTSRKGGIPSDLLPGDWSIFVLGDICPQTLKVYATAGAWLYTFDLHKGSSASRLETDCPIHGVAISPKGDAAVLVESRGAMNVGILDLDKRTVRIITPFTSKYNPIVRRSSISWCSKGERILFGPKRKRGTVDSDTLLLVDPSTSELTPHFTRDYIRAFTLGPHDQIAYADNRNRLYVVDEDGSSRVIADNCVPCTRNSIDWSSDGRWIAYEGEDENIWVVGTRGTAVRVGAEQPLRTS